MRRTKKFYMKAFLYLGGTAILLLGGAIILIAPYHYVGFIATPGSAGTFSIYEAENFYPQLELSVTVKPNNVSIVFVDFTIVDNATQEIRTVNMTITDSNQIPGTNPPAFYKAIVVDLPPGDYTIYIDHIEGAGWIDIGFEQLSNKVSYIAIGTILNIVGLIMIISGYFVSGSLIVPDSQIIVDWGYADEE